MSEVTGIGTLPSFSKCYCTCLYGIQIQDTYQTVPRLSQQIAVFDLAFKDR